MPGGVPMTMQTFAITLAAVVLGAKLSTVSSVIYLLLGAVGVPVLANFSGGFDKFIGPTGGFLISFPLMAFIIGWGADHRHAFRGAYVLALIVGTIANYVVGTAMFCVLMNSSITAGVTACVLPFIPTAVIKAVLATVIGFLVRKRIPGSRHDPAAPASSALHARLLRQGIQHGFRGQHECGRTSAAPYAGEKIRLTFGPDSLCACCPHNTDGLCDTQEKVSRFDRKTVEYFGLHEGEYVYQDLIRAIDAQMTPAMLEDICRGCAWYPVSACKKNICGK